MAAHPPVQLSPLFPGRRLGTAIDALGGRCFGVRHTGSAADGDLIVAAPDAAGVRSVLVPRGLGRPLLARPVAGGWQAEATGEGCTPRRWVAVGGLAARIRTIALPRGPAPVVRPGRKFVGSMGPILALRLVAAPWAAACQADASLAQGPVAIVDRFVRAASPDAVAVGVCSGMSLRLARRRCPHLRMIPLADLNRRGADLLAAAAALLDAELGTVEVEGPAILVRLPEAPVGELIGLVERTMLRLWQALGLRVRAAITADRACAVGLSRLLDPEMLAYVPGTASAVWRRGVALRAGAGRRSPSPSIPDVEGVVTRVRALVAHVSGPGVVLVRCSGGIERIFVPDGPSAAVAAEAAVRQVGVRLGEVFALRWQPRARPAGGAQQLRLLPAARLAR